LNSQTNFDSLGIGGAQRWMSCPARDCPIPRWSEVRGVWAPPHSRNDGSSTLATLTAIGSGFYPVCRTRARTHAGRRSLSFTPLFAAEGVVRSLPAGSGRPATTSRGTAGSCPKNSSVTRIRVRPWWAQQGMTCGKRYPIKSPFIAAAMEQQIRIVLESGSRKSRRIADLEPLPSRGAASLACCEYCKVRKRTRSRESSKSLRYPDPDARPWASALASSLNTRLSPACPPERRSSRFSRLVRLPAGLRFLVWAWPSLSIQAVSR